MPLYSLKISGIEDNLKDYLIPVGAEAIERLLLGVPEKPHFEFVGWATTPSGSLISLENLVVESDLNLYAIWKELPKYSVKYFSNGILKSVPLAKSYWSDGDSKP